jgi:outer membrane protein
MQEAMGKQLQDEFGAKRDSIVEKMRSYVKEYGKKNGYDYIYGTGDAASVLYAKEGFDITDKLVKELNDKYKGSPEAKAAKEPATEEKK